MEYDKELSELAKLLRLGAETARHIADARKRDEDAILRLAAQAEIMAAEIDGIVGQSQSLPSFLLRRDK